MRPAWLLLSVLCFSSSCAVATASAKQAEPFAGAAHRSPSSSSAHSSSSSSTPRDDAPAIAGEAFPTTLGGKMCEEGGYCSAGHSRFWTGDIGPSHKLREMLDAVSYKKEIILTVLTSSDEQTVWLDPVLQLHWDLERHGYAHLVVHTASNTTCHELHKYRNVSCVWDASPSVKGFKESRHGVWFIRWKFFARVGRMGYNAMSIDADTIWFRDPYVHFKRKPMSDIQLHCNFEGGGPLHCTGGFIYIQNILPNGPVSWVFKNIVDDQMWMMDDAFKTIKDGGGDPVMCHFYDQELIFDAIKSAFIGRPVVWDYFVTCRDKDWRIKNRLGTNISRNDVLNNIRTVCGKQDDYKNETTVPLPEGWMPKGHPVPYALTRHLVNRLTVPNVRYGWPAELGGRLGPKGRNGNYTRQWERTLREDCPSCPWWDDDRPLKGGRDDLDVVLGPRLNGEGGKWVDGLFVDEHMPTELLGIGPPWLANSMTGFRDGIWAGPGEPGLGHTTAVVHVHHWPYISSWHKTVVRKVVGRYNWTLGALTAPNHTPYTSGYPVRKVLALHPSIDLSRTRSWAEYNSIVLGLLQVAQLTHRTAVFPDIPCEAAWLHNDVKHRPCAAPVNQDHNKWPLIWSVPYAYDPKDPTRQLVGGWLQADNLPASATLSSSSAEAAHPGTSSGRAAQGAPRLYRSAEERAEFWQDKKFMFSISWNADFDCTRDIGNPGALMAHELAHWLTTSAARGATLQPTQANTAFTVADDAAGQAFRIPPVPDVQAHGEVRMPSKERGWSVADAQVLLPIGQVMVEMSRFSNEPIVFLGHPIAMVNSTTRRARGDPHKHGNLHLQHGGGGPLEQQRRHERSLMQGLLGRVRKLSKYELPEMTGARGKLIGDDVEPSGAASHGPVFTVEDFDGMYWEAMNRTIESNCKVLVDRRLPNHTNVPLDWSLPHARLGMLHNHQIRTLPDGTVHWWHAPRKGAAKAGGHAQHALSKPSKQSAQPAA